MTKKINEPDEFLRCFFGEGNSLKWASYENGGPDDAVRTALDPWVERFRKNVSPFVLPRVDLQSKRTAWYIMCTDPREARSMRESLHAFVGSTYTNFNGELANLDSADPIDQLCSANFGSLVFRLPVVNNDDRTTVVALLNMLFKFRDENPGRTAHAIKPIGRLLRDLEMAILVSNEDSSKQIYDEVRGRGRLSATNLAFLQVHILGSFDRWDEILSLPNLNDLLQVRRPKRVSQQIATAFYRQKILKHEEANDPKAAIATLSSSDRRYQSLVRSTDGYVSPDAIKLAVVSAIASDPPNRRRAERLIKTQVVEQDHAWCKSVIDLVSRPSHPAMVAESITLYDEAELRYADGDFDQAFQLYLDQPPTFKSACRILETAVEIDSITAAEKAINFVDNSSSEIQSKILGRRTCPYHIELLTELLGKGDDGKTESINSWEAWFNYIDDTVNLDNALNILEHGSGEWTVKTNGTTGFNASRIGELIKQPRTGRSSETLRNAVPIIIKSFLIDASANRENKPVYLALIELLIYDEAIGLNDLIAIEQLVEAVLTTSPSLDKGNNDYEFAVDIAKHLWETAGSPRHLDWVLSMLDLLVDTGTQQHANLTPILAAIIESVTIWSRRVTDDQWIMLELLANDLGLPEMVACLRPSPDESEVDPDDPDIRGLLNGKSIVVYSLTERIARRFGQLAEQMFDGIKKIHYVHDKSLTDRMKRLAKSSDIFIVNTWDAKHAATNGVKDNRPPSFVTLEPEGKSASSLLRCLKQFAETLQPN